MITQSFLFLSLFVSTFAHATVYNIHAKSLEVANAAGLPVQIQFRSETISTSGSSAANTFAEAIQIRVASCASGDVTAKLRGVTTMGADIIQIVKLQKIGECIFLGTPIYSLLISSIDRGQQVVTSQQLEIESNRRTILNVDLSLGQ